MTKVDSYNVSQLDFDDNAFAGHLKYTLTNFLFYKQLEGSDLGPRLGRGYCT